jgi:hypothetical protein
MKKLIFLLIASTNFLFSQTYKIDTIQYVGHTETNYDLVVMAEGYTQAEIPKFQTDAKRVKEMLMGNDIYSKLLPKMNIFSIGTISAQSGISLKTDFPQPNDPIKVANIKNTIFGIYFQNNFRAYYLDEETIYKAKQIAAENIPFSEVVLIVTNDEDHSSGRASYQGVAVVTRVKDNDLNWSRYLVNHELSHSVGGLSDEYSSEKEFGFNKDITNDSTKIRWKDLLPLPDVKIDSLVTGVYIPNKDCMMCLGDGKYTCPVCSRRLKEVVEGVSTKIASPHRLVLQKFDKDKKTITYTWDASAGATNYEVIFFASWRNSMIAKTTNANSVTFDLTTEDVTAIPGWRLDVVIRAFNATASSSFLRYRTSIHATINLSIPVASISKLSETSHRMIISNPENAGRVNWIRLFNEVGNHSDILIKSNEIRLNNLVQGKKYFYQLAAAIPDEASDFIPSPFSAKLPLNGTSTSVIDVIKERDYTIAPNPVTKDQLVILLSDDAFNKAIDVDLVDHLGKLRKQIKTIGQSSLAIDIQELELGVFFAIIKAGAKTTTMKFIRNE